MTALGPSSSLSKPLILVPLAARRARVFFTTVIFRPLAPRRRRIRLFFVPSIPLGLMTATPSSGLNFAVSSFSIRFLTFLLMVGFPLDSGFQINRRRHRSLQHDFPDVQPLGSLRLHLADLIHHRV